MARPFATIAATIEAGVSERLAPCAVAEVGTSSGAAWTHAAGTLEGDVSSPRAGETTVFDLASLTKVIATTTLMARAVESGRLRLDSPVSQCVPAWRGADREDVTLRDLLAHCSGLPAHLALYRECEGRVDFEPAIAGTALEYVPRQRAVYSDLGFMLLGFVLEDRGGSDLGTQFDVAGRGAGTTELTYTPPRSWRSRFAPTGVSAWRGRMLAGEVHDDNCRALGGLAGHAGLFGTARAVGCFARWLLQSVHGRAHAPMASPATLRAFFERTRVPGSSRALGWDTMLPSSSCGPDMPASAVGHTGFTGTSLWVDWEGDAYFVLLTNRVLFDDRPGPMRDFRRRFHTAAVAALLS